MDSDEDEPSLAELMNALVLQLNLRVQDLPGLGVVLNRYVDVADIARCRSISRILYDPCTEVLQNRSFVRLNDVLKTQRYTAACETMTTIWSNYVVYLNSQLMVDNFLYFALKWGRFVHTLDLEMRYREGKLDYLEELLAERLPNLQELTLRGHFPISVDFPHPERLYRRLLRLRQFNLYARGWNLILLQEGEVEYTNKVIGHLLSAMPNLQKMKYFPDTENPRETHRHYMNLLYTLSQLDFLSLPCLTEIESFTMTFVDVDSVMKFGLKRYPLQKLTILLEDDISMRLLVEFVESFYLTLRHLVIRSASERPMSWPRLPNLQELDLHGVNIDATDMLSNFPALRTFHVSQDRVTAVDFLNTQALLVPHTSLRKVKLVEGCAVNVGRRISNLGLAILCRDLPSLRDLTIIQIPESTQPTFNDVGFIGMDQHTVARELSYSPRDLLLINRGLTRQSHFIRSMAVLRRLHIESSNITDLTLLAGVVNCEKLEYLKLACPQISGSACLETIQYLHELRELRILDYGHFPPATKAEIVRKMRNYSVFYTPPPPIEEQLQQQEQQPQQQRPHQPNQQRPHQPNQQRPHQQQPNQQRPHQQQPNQQRPHQQQPNQQRPHQQQPHQQPPHQQWQQQQPSHQQWQQQQQRQF